MKKIADTFLSAYFGGNALSYNSMSMIRKTIYKLWLFEVMNQKVFRQRIFSNIQQSAQSLALMHFSFQGKEGNTQFIASRCTMTQLVFPSNRQTILKRCEEILSYFLIL
ncbi:hypothetical protein PHYBLDRAFT_175604 [Phycomyces blakesleeanus NRRL 1555(-)]|uniref:Uncharacterized protein n=1 Tax=Phycomyces blakesleeanus (strain ATCC 8743b / DSM 1359 / FGSC 10004 / NBRC 33097 / NRRL 1555) TaxID=763407 RepID=A0A162ZDP2_PHYB8|nr:hypothetical protein PHYBLDRAFT_175604 [Phycomyces blakesleeanus NRRL 1555(-)]OAD66081.1 hypothetical protein PHYBLDRAFT_175604 [Phycomyces blakesleeanus NRRL 1555(-)]|eukprot:XP_018284121.1 hypothetical protein PHYBLDRAFT_175604 [Phycomyces blakesleeanus NRRL 1555(-)]